MIQKLQKCKNRESVEQVFEKHHIQDISKKRYWLEWAMGVPTLFFTKIGDDDITEDEIHALTLEMFFQKRTDLSTLYKKLGFPLEKELKKQKRINEKLDTCFSFEQIDKVLIDEKITDTIEKIKTLREAMGMQSLYGRPLSNPQEDYEFDCGVFLEGSWRGY